MGFQWCRMGFRVGLRRFRGKRWTQCPLANDLHLRRHRRLCSFSAVKLAHLSKTSLRMTRTTLSWEQAARILFFSTAIVLGQPSWALAQGGPAESTGALKLEAKQGYGEDKGSAPVAQSSESESKLFAPAEQTLPRWDYGSERGPSKWGGLADAYRVCACGRFQSPIALSEREALRFEYSPATAPFELKSNIAQWKQFEPFPPGIQPPMATFEQYIPPPPPIVGDVPPVTGFEAPPPAAILILRELPPELPRGANNSDAAGKVAEAPTPLKLNDAQAQQYRLVNVHFHAPQSEHVIEQVRGDLEMHAVFRNVSDENDVAVIGRIWRAVPDESPASKVAQGATPAPNMESPAVPRWLDGLLSLLEESPSDKASNLDASNGVANSASLTFTANSLDGTGATVSGASTASIAAGSPAQVSSDATTYATTSRTGGLRATRYVEFNFADTLFHDVTSRSSTVASPASEIESGMALAAEELDPEARPSFFYYRGSLTTPPCSENIKWIVLTHRDPLPRRVVDRILAVQQGQPNVRPLQPRNERPVLYYTPDGLAPSPPARSSAGQKGT